MPHRRYIISTLTVLSLLLTHSVGCAGQQHQQDLPTLSAQEQHWLNEFSGSNRLEMAKSLIRQLRAEKPGKGFEKQFRLYDVIKPPHQLSDEAMAELNRLAGDSASAELRAQQLFRQPAQGSIRMMADHRIAEQLAGLGKIALPALYRLLRTNQRPPIWMAALNYEVLWAISKIGEPQAVEQVVAWASARGKYTYDLAPVLVRFGYRVIPKLSEYLQHEDDRVRTGVWNAIGELTVQDTPRSYTHRAGKTPRLDKLPSDAGKRFLQWWQRRRAFYLGLPPRDSVLIGKPVRQLAVAIPEFQLGTHYPRVEVGIRWMGQMGTRTRMANSLFTFYHLTVQTPVGRTIELRNVGTTPQVIEQIMKHENRKPTFDLYNETWVEFLGTSSSISPTSRWYRKPDESGTGNVFEEPGKYRVRITFEVPQDAPGDWHGRAHSPWATLWVIRPDEWKK